MAGSPQRNSLPSMKSHTHSPGDDAAAAHRQELQSEPTRNERPARADVFSDLRRRNERRASMAEARLERMTKNRPVVRPKAIHRVSSRSS
jgi:hypothetical protein